MKRYKSVDEAIRAAWQRNRGLKRPVYISVVADGIAGDFFVAIYRPHDYNNLYTAQAGKVAVALITPQNTLHLYYSEA